MRDTTLSFASSLLLQSTLALSVANSLPKGVIDIPLVRIVNQSSYGVEFEIGTPPQKTTLLFDSGSPTMGVLSPRSNECLQANKPCEMYGSYDNLTSSTAKYAGTNYQDLLSDHGSGIFVNDTVRVAGVTIDDIEFGVKEFLYAAYELLAPGSGIFGMGQNCFDETCTSYNTFLQQLYDRKIVSTRAYSVYLGPDEPDAVGSLLLGGIDKAKQGKKVHTIPMIDVLSIDADNAPFNVNLTSFSFTVNGNETKVDMDAGTTGYLDTGNSAWGLPEALWPAVVDYFGIDKSLRVFDTPFIVDCKFRKPTKDTISVQFVGKASISMTMDRLVSKLDDGTCGTYVMGVKTVLGDPFFRNVYAVLDMDSKTVSLSEVNYTNDTDIVAI